MGRRSGREWLPGVEWGGGVVREWWSGVEWGGGVVVSGGQELSGEEEWS